MNNKIRLTESQLHRVIKESVKRVLRESHGEPESYKCIMIDNILDDSQATEIAQDMGYDSEEEAAKAYFNETMYESDESESMCPKYRKFICDLDDDYKLYHDYAGQYYFAMKQIGE